MPKMPPDAEFHWQRLNSLYPPSPPAARHLAAAIFITPGLLLVLFALLLLLSGCGTMPSPSACPQPSAPEAVTAPVPLPVYLPPGEAVPEDLLDNLAINAEIANELRSRLRAIQAWAKSIGAMK